jgi:tetratricopeptide (TPR) repeat protein
MTSREPCCSFDSSKLRELGPLLEDGTAEEFQRRVLNCCPPEAEWTQDDVGIVCALLHGAQARFGARARALYDGYARRLRSAEGDRLWLATLPLRSNVVASIEGSDATVAWLRDLLAQVLPPAVGFVHLELGRTLVELGRLEEARSHLRSAAQLSLHGLEWYSLEAFSIMATCLLKLGLVRLAFEYARSHALTSYRLGRIPGEDLPRALEGLSAAYGQLDYWCELERNFAARHREERAFSAAAERESQAAFRLAQMGALAEAASSFARAAEDARRGHSASDPPFAQTCRYLSLLLDPAPLSAAAVDQAVEDCRQLWLPHAFVIAWREALVEHQWVTSDCARLGAVLRGASHGTTPREDHGELLNLAQLVALVGRLCSEADNPGGAAGLWSAVLSLRHRDDALFVFVGERLAEAWLQLGRPAAAFAVAESFARRRRVLPHERFIFGALSVRALLALGRTEAAWMGSGAVLTDWSRVLQGLYAEDHKAAWLRRGAAAVDSALAAIASPVPWMSEDRRRREVFRLHELGKARMITDLVARSGRLTGAFSSARTGLGEDDVMEWGSADGGDWYVPMMVQAISFSDSMSLIVHEDDGTVHHSQPIDLAPLRYAVRLPQSPERRLVVSAESLSFAESDARPYTGLYEDMMRLMQPDER